MIWGTSGPCFLSLREIPPLDCRDKRPRLATSIGHIYNEKNYPPNPMLDEVYNVLGYFWGKFLFLLIDSSIGLQSSTSGKRFFSL
jgi:hypothetical protein